MAKPIVHFTHHVCQTLGIASVDLMPKGPDGFRHQTIFQQAFGNEEAEPLLNVCDVSWRTRRPQFTDDYAKVTCPKCRTVNDERILRSWDSKKTWLPADELRARAWVACCRHVACPRPRDIAERTVRLERCLVAQRMQRAFDGVLVFIGLGESEYVEKLSRAMTKIPSECLDAMGPAIDEMRMIGDVLEELTKMRTRAERVIEDVAKRIADGPLLAPRLADETATRMALLSCNEIIEQEAA